MLGGGDPFYLKFWVNRPQLERNRRFSVDICSSASAVASSKKSSNTNMKSTTRFPLSLTSYVAPKAPKGNSKTQNGRFPRKIALCSKKVCYKVSLCENCQRQSCMALIGLSTRVKTIGGGYPFYVKI